MDPQQQQPEPTPHQPPAPSPLAPTPAPQDAQPTTEQTEPQQNDQQTPSQQGAEQQQPAQEQQPQMEAISWEASESVHHEKDALWFVGVLVVTAVFAIISIFLIKSWSFSILIIVMAIAVLVFAKRPPRIMQYVLTGNGIDVNGHHHSFTEFRAFGVVQDGPFHYITLLPTKRFMPAMDVYFPDENAEGIVDILGSKIPMQTIKPDLLDVFTKTLRF